MPTQFPPDLDGEQPNDDTPASGSSSSGSEEDGAPIDSSSPDSGASNSSSGDPSDGDSDRPSAPESDRDSGTGADSDSSSDSSSDDDSSGDDSSDSTGDGDSPDGDSDSAAADDQQSLADAGDDADQNAGDGDVNQVSPSCESDRPPQPGTLIVTVKDDSGSVVPDADVTISGASGGSAKTKADGTAKFENLTPGSYDTDGSKDGYVLTNASKGVNVPAGGTGKGQITLLKIVVEIEINNTPANTDDIVQLKCNVPPHRHKVPCRIKLKKATPSDIGVVLTNPDSKLRFPESGDTTKAVTLAAAGGWSAFEISGESKSGAIGDASIEAHLNTAGGVLVGSKPATVFWFDSAKMSITAGGSYTVSGGRWTVAGAHTVDFSAEATIKPAGVNCGAPQVKDLRIGIMQNALAGVTRERTWGNPTIAWNAGVAAGTSVNVPSNIQMKITRPATGNDSTAQVTPLYDQPGKVGADGTLDANSLKKPKGCTGGAASTSFDTPSTTAPAPLTLPAKDASGTVVGQVTYQPTAVKLTPSFTTWAVVFNVATNDFCCLRQRGWSLNADALGAAGQKAAVDAADADATTTPVLAPFANDQTNDPANTSQVPVGAATTPFTK